MRIIDLEAADDLIAWRQKARDLLRSGTLPDAVHWRTPRDRGQSATDLFAAEPSPPLLNPAMTGATSRLSTVAADASSPTVPRAFFDLAADVICHRAADRFDLLYRIAWRLAHEEPHLLKIAADADMHRATRLAKAIRRDKHKMKAFVRFREIAHVPNTFVAWFEPENHIVRATAPFFMRRFASMHWSILTPEASAHWDGTHLTFGSGATRGDVPSDDRLEAYWLTYFASIFNPARLNTKAMQAEMPKRYWKNMPEAALIPELVRNAIPRTQEMLAASSDNARNTAGLRGLDGNERRGDHARAGTTGTRATTVGDPATADVATIEPAVIFAPTRSLDDMRTQLDSCRRCSHWCTATQPVPGSGPAGASMMIVGEQPGDQEDLVGLPFVGPAGALLDRALSTAGVDRKAIYVTNAVKHFKFEPRGKRRIHKTPNAKEIDHCRWWLDEERRLIAPSVIVALGSTAARSVFGHAVRLRDMQGHASRLADGTRVIATAHPAAILRSQTDPDTSAMFDDLVAALQLAKMIADPATAATADTAHKLDRSPPDTQIKRGLLSAVS